MNNNDWITVFTQYTSAGKTFTRNDDGTVSKESAIVAFATGQVHYVPTVESFAAVIREVSDNSNQAVMLGYIKGTEDGKPFELTSKKDYLERGGSADELFFLDTNGNKVTARLKKHVTGSSWIMLDRDITDGMSDEMANLSLAGWLACMEVLMPGLKGCAKVIIPSSTGRLIVDGVQQATQNFHCYIQIKDPHDLERIGHAMLINSFDVGLGYHKPIGSGDVTVPWSIFDATTFSRERLCYEAQPVVIGQGLSVAQANIKVYPGGVFDSSSIITPEGTRHGLRMSSNGSGSSIDAGELQLDQLIETNTLGSKTVRQIRDGDYTDKIRCQCFNRNSVSMNAYLQKLPNGQIFYFDNGQRIGFKTKIDVDEVLAGFDIRMVEPAIGELITLGKHPVDDVTKPDEIANVLMSQPQIQDLHLIYYQGTIYKYDGSGYQELGNNWLRMQAMVLLPQCYHLDPKNDMPVKGSATVPNANNVASYIIAGLQDDFIDEQSPPFYRDGKTHPEQIDADELIVFRNGSLNKLTGEFNLPSSNIFTLSALPYDYDINAGVPKRFMQLLDETWSDDKSSHDLLQEMLCSILWGDVSIDGLFYLIGVPGSGKGVLSKLIKLLVGKENTSSVTIKNATEQFGLASLIGKIVWILSDVRVGKYVDQTTALERLLAIGSDDSVNIPRKNRTAWEGELGIRVVVAANEMPRINDPSGAMARRIIPLKFENSFKANPDPKLIDKLTGELSGIINWSLEGLERLQANGRFTNTNAYDELMEMHEEVSNPLYGFTGTHIEYDQNSQAVAADVFALWKSFSQREGINHIADNKRAFTRLLKQVYPDVKGDRIGKNKITMYQGIRIISGVGLDGMQVNCINGNESLHN